jgi:hypothetical protein
MEVSESKIWILWLIVIPFGQLLGWLLHHFWDKLTKPVQRTMLGFFAVSIFVALCTIFSPWSFRGYWLQAINLSMAYISATCLGCLAFKDSLGSLMLLARGVAVFVALFTYCGLIDAYLRADLPYTQTKLGDHLILRRSSGGWAGIDWEGIAIIQQPAWLPFLEKTLYTQHIGNAGDCNENTMSVKPDPVSREIRVQCGQTVPQIFVRVKIP